VARVLGVQFSWGWNGFRHGDAFDLKVHEEYPDQMMLTFSVFPSPKVSDTVCGALQCYALCSPTCRER